MSGIVTWAVRLLAAAALLALLWGLFRLAMGLRWTKVSREAARRRIEDQGQRVVAELPLEEDLVFFVEDGDVFRWGASAVAKPEVMGARLLLNGAVVGSVARNGTPLPELPPPVPGEGREVWEVVLHLRRGGAATVPCGRLREGVSRDTARQVYEAVRRVIAEAT